MNASNSVKQFLLLTAVLLCASASCLAADKEPIWAYGTEPKPAPRQSASSTPEVPKDALLHLPGSKFSFTEAEINNPFGPADWFPNDHPPMPGIVAHGRRPTIWACSLCHYPNGKGRTENAGVAGLPVSYFIHQLSDFKNGLRHSADPRKQNTNLMIAYAKAMTDDEIEAAARYFGSMEWTPWIRVQETTTVPKTRISVGMYLPLPGNEREPIGHRIIEVPENPRATKVLRDPHSGFIAYVPVGSVKKGEALVKTGAGKTIACATCHGPGLKGLGPVPGIAGRSPSYLVRQLYDMQQGTRKGEWTQLMIPVVQHLTDDDLIAIAAYTSSLKP